MGLSAAADMITAWIQNVHTESAPARIAEMRNNHHLKERQGVRAASPGGAVLGRIFLHEAAHAVCAHLCGLRAGRVVVREDGSGAAEYAGGEDDPLSLVIAHTAGIAAELLAGDVDEGRLFSLAHSSDVLAARLVCDEHGEANGWTSDAVAKMVVCTVASNWSAIVRIAQLLRATGELSGDEVAALCAPLQ